MNIRVCFMGSIANLTGEKELPLVLHEAPTLRGVLDQLEQRFGPEFGERVFRSANPPRQLQKHTRIFVNRKLVDDEALDESLPPPPDANSSSEILVYLLHASCGG
jgi:molybdopterin converting factor small subunit